MVLRSLSCFQEIESPGFGEAFFIQWQATFSTLSKRLGTLAVSIRNDQNVLVRRTGSSGVINKLVID
jgi:hypothetical protein